MQDISEKQYGQGLNSLRIRFTLLIAGVGLLLALAASVWAVLLHHARLPVVLSATVAICAIFAACVWMTYRMTGNLTRPIESLRQSTEAIAQGDYDALVDVECSCEVGGLADSFRGMVTRLNANVSKIQTLAYEDGVTGLPNRAVLTEALAKLEGKSGALFFIDLDNFKQVNDVYGHQVGELLLQQASSRILTQGLGVAEQSMESCLAHIADGQGVACDCRVLFRFAGDEFVAILGSVDDKAELSEIASRIVDSLTAPFRINGHTMSIGCSIGIAFVGADTTDGTDLTKFADLAMYEAKKAGRGQFRFFDEGMRAEALERRQLERDFLDALTDDQLVVHYQPKFAASHGGLVGLEALVRWQHPTLGLLYPGKFLPIAEANGLVGKIGEAVLRKVVAQIKAWNERGHLVSVAVNVCPNQLLDNDFSDRLLTMIEYGGVSASSIALEVTENLALADNPVVRRHIEELRSGGVKIAIDDFGVGYSNLSKLYRVPFDSLKLDRSLVEGIDVDQTARHVVASTIALAHGLGQSVVAEGVERQSQLAVLRELDCDEIQGFLLGKPLDSSIIESRFLNSADRAPVIEQQRPAA